MMLYDLCIILQLEKKRSGLGLLKKVLQLLKQLELYILILKKVL
jgi:hypothetical protein